MFHEIRTYRLKNGTIPACLKAIGRGIATRKTHLGPALAIFIRNASLWRIHQ